MERRREMAAASGRKRLEASPGRRAIERGILQELARDRAGAVGDKGTSGVRDGASRVRGLLTRGGDEALAPQPRHNLIRCSQDGDELAEPADTDRGPLPTTWERGNRQAEHHNGGIASKGLSPGPFALSNTAVPASGVAWFRLEIPASCPPSAPPVDFTPAQAAARAVGAARRARNTRDQPPSRPPRHKSVVLRTAG